MLNLKESLKIAEKKENSSFKSYSEYKDNFIFCMGDPECWTCVNKKTGKVSTLWRNALIFEHIDDDEFCEELNNACLNAKSL